jgi:hypothetical protein
MIQLRFLERWISLSQVTNQMPHGHRAEEVAVLEEVECRTRLPDPDTGPERNGSGVTFPVYAVKSTDLFVPRYVILHR